MNRKQITVIIVTPLVALILGFGIYYYFRPIPIGDGTGLFPGEGVPIGPGDGEAPDEEVNIPFFVPGTEMTQPRLYELHKTPVAGVGFMETGLVVSSSKTTTTRTKSKTPPPLEPHTVTARYIERGLGHMYETPLATLAETRIVNETRPRIAEAFFGNNGKTVVVRSLNTEHGEEVITTRILNLLNGGATTSTSSPFIKTEEVFLPDYIPFLAVAEDNTEKLFYLASGLTASTGSLATFKGATTAIFNSSFTEWLPQFPNQNLVALASRPSSNVHGSLFFLDTKTKALTKVLDGLNGLTAKVSRDGKYVLYSTTREGRPELFVYDVAKKESTYLFTQTLPEKCVWSAKETTVVYCAVPQTMDTAIYPDQWYRGTIAFSDKMVRLDTIALATPTTIFVPSEYRAPALDIINPVLSSDDSFILFMNKNSGTPWVYRIAEVAPPASAALPVATTTPATQTSIAPPNLTTEGMTKIK